MSIVIDNNDGVILYFTFIDYRFVSVFLLSNTDFSLLLSLSNSNTDYDPTFTWSYLLAPNGHSFLFFLYNSFFLFYFFFLIMNTYI